MKILLILAGIAILILHKFVFTISFESQFLVFIFGLIIIGIPHGAADLMVASKNTLIEKKTFSISVFLLKYVGRLVFFGLILYYFPLIGILLFIFFSAYHFGETDLSNIQSETIFGKGLIISFGLIILSFVLMTHFEEVKPMMMYFNSGIKYQKLIDWLNGNRSIVISICIFLFLICLKFYQTKDSSSIFTSVQLVELIINLIIIINLPLILAFTYYFIVWHSVLSLSNIIKFLKTDGDLYSTKIIIFQIIFFGLLAVVSIAIFIYSKFTFISINGIISYCFLGLAVLTLPHLTIMHNMYQNLRIK